jgi:glycosyltransferase involved in cell wall biosynthesis
MRIGLSLLHARPSIGGGWNYISNLLSALGKHDSNNTYVVYVTHYGLRLVPKKPNFETKLVNINPNNKFLRVAYENLIFPLLIEDQRLDCMHWFGGTIPLLFKGPSLVTIYDLKAFFRGKSSIIQEVYVRWATRYAVHNASFLLPISYYTKQELLSVFGIDASNLFVGKSTTCLQSTGST